VIFSPSVSLAPFSFVVFRLILLDLVFRICFNPSVSFFQVSPTVSSCTFDLMAAIYMCPSLQKVRKPGETKPLLNVLVVPSTSTSLASTISSFVMSPLPIELIIKILKLYFHTDTHSTPLSVQVPCFSFPHAASLRLVHSSFLSSIDGTLLLFRTVVLRISEDWARYFADDSGVLVSGEGSDERA
jgi:hypothetical protein